MHPGQSGSAEELSTAITTCLLPSSKKDIELAVVVQQTGSSGHREHSQITSDTSRNDKQRGIPTTRTRTGKSQTLVSLPWPSQSLSQSQLYTSSTTDISHESAKGNTSSAVKPLPQTHRRPQIDKLRKHQSSHAIQSSCKALTTPRGRSDKRRCISLDAADRARRLFESPDRYVSSPSPSSRANSQIRLSRPVTNLTPQERYDRSRNPSTDPFRAQSISRSRTEARGRLPHARHRRVSPPQYTPSFVHGTDAAPRHIDANVAPQVLRQISAGSVWGVGGQFAAQHGPALGVSDGRGGLLNSGTNAPMHVAHFLERETSDEDRCRHENRLALALEIDPTNKILPTSQPSPGLSPFQNLFRLAWRNNAWSRPVESFSPARRKASSPERDVPTTPFRVLDAPRIRDDYYCSVLAYSYTCHSLAVAIGNLVYIWSEERGVQHPPLPPTRLANYVTSLSFSSTEGAHGILAIGRQSGNVSLWSPMEGETRFESQHPNPVSCLAFKPIASKRPSTQFPGQQTKCEDLLVGDDIGDIYYYSVEWTDSLLRNLDPSWTGSMTLLARISAHTQQICGIAWSPTGDSFATGGNDNVALFFQCSTIFEQEPDQRGRSRYRQNEPPQPIITPLTPPTSPRRGNTMEVGGFSNLLGEISRAQPSPSPSPLIRSLPNILGRAVVNPLIRPIPRPNSPLTPPTTPLRPRAPTPYHSAKNPPSISRHSPNIYRHIFPHTAAVKALAFAPWQPSLLATGGGSNDRAIHFWHTGSGAKLASINVFAQVTCLIWSRGRREICACFGYAQPEHGVRVAVFGWPEGECRVSVRWEGRTGGGAGAGEVPRALWAVAYPGGPNSGVRRRGRKRGRGRVDERDVEVEERREGEAWASRTEDEGCIVVAGSDESIKFHEVWAGRGSGLRKLRRGGKKEEEAEAEKVEMGAGLGTTPGVLGGSKILEGVWEGIEVEFDGEGERDGGGSGRGIREIIR